MAFKPLTRAVGVDDSWLVTVSRWLLKPEEVPLALMALRYRARAVGVADADSGATGGTTVSPPPLDGTGADTSSGCGIAVAIDAWLALRLGSIGGPIVDTVAWLLLCPRGTGMETALDGIEDLLWVLLPVSTGVTRSKGMLHDPAEGGREKGAGTLRAPDDGFACLADAIHEAGPPPIVGVACPLGSPRELPPRRSPVDPLQFRSIALIVSATVRALITTLLLGLLPPEVAP